MAAKSHAKIKAVPLALVLLAEGLPLVLGAHLDERVLEGAGEGDDGGAGVVLVNIVLNLGQPARSKKTLSIVGVPAPPRRSSGGRVGAGRKEEEGKGEEEGLLLLAALVHPNGWIPAL